jgi:hypothetical protein
VFQLSALLSLSALRQFTRGLQVASLRTGRFFAGALLDHYSETLNEIHHTGYLTYWVREFRPYVRAAAGHFSPRRRSFTQRVLWKKG